MNLKLRKEKRKAYNQRMKERRKINQVFVSQRRMNYEERKQILNKDDIESEKDVNNQEEDNKTNIHLKRLTIYGLTVLCQYPI